MVGPSSILQVLSVVRMIITLTKGLCYRIVHPPFDAPLSMDSPRSRSCRRLCVLFFLHLKQLPKLIEYSLYSDNAAHFNMATCVSEPSRYHRGHPSEAHPLPLSFLIPSSSWVPFLYALIQALILAIGCDLLARSLIDLRASRADCCTYPLSATIQELQHHFRYHLDLNLNAFPSLHHFTNLSCLFSD